MRKIKLVVCRMMPAWFLVPFLIACRTPSMMTPAPVPTLIPPTITAALPTPTTLSTPAPAVTAPVSDNPPFHLIATPSDGTAPLSVTFQIELTTPYDIVCVVTRLDFGDGTVEQRAIPACSPFPAGRRGVTPTPQPMSRVVTHVYTLAGRYDAMICMERPCEASGHVTIIVH